MKLTSKKISRDINILVNEIGYNENLSSKIIDYLEYNNMLHLLPNIIKNLEDINKEKDILNSCKIYSSHKLSDKIITDIKSDLDINSTETNFTVDSNLIGGFIVEHKGVIYDASILNTLNKAERLLAK